MLTSSVPHRLADLRALALRPLTTRRLWSYAAILIAADLLAYGVFAVVAAGWQGYPLAKAIARDFVAPYTGGRFFWEGRLAELYHDPALTTFQNELIGLTQADGFHRFINPPFTVLVFAPFALGGYGVGLAAYYAAGLAAIVGAAALVQNSLAPGPGASLGRLVIMALLFYPTLAWVLFAQYSPLALLLYTAFFVLARRGQDFKAGLMLGLLAYKPQLALGLALVLLVQGRWRAVLGGLAGGVALVVLGFAVSPTAMLTYARVVPHLMETQIDGAWAEHSLMFFGVLLAGSLGQGAGQALGALLTLGGAALLVAWWRGQTWQPGTRAWDLRMAATLALGLLVSPHLYIYDLLLLLLPLAIVWAHYPRPASGRALDGGTLLIASVGLWLALYLARYTTLAQLRLMEAAGGPPSALQFSTLVVLAWAGLVNQTAAGSAESVRLAGARPGEAVQ